MQYPSNLPASVEMAGAVLAPRKQRRHHRQKIQTLAYVNLDEANGGVIRDLSESGLAVQAVAALRVNQQVQLRFDLLSPRLRVETTGRIAWANASGQAGVEFLTLSRRSRRLLREWLFTQLLARTHQLSWDSVFVHQKQGEATELVFSAAPRPTIHLEPQAFAAPEPPSEDLRPPALHFAWYPFPISPRGFARLADGLILLCAVLLFWVMSLVMTQVLPTWPVAVALAFGSGGIFAAVYWLLFMVWAGATPGMYLARLAGCDCESSKKPEDDRPRFR